MMLRRVLALVGATMMLAAVTAAPALADKPIVENDSDAFTGWNPCTEEDHEVTINYETSIHEHGHNFVLTSKTTGTTSDDFVMKGVERVVDSEVVEGTGIFHFSFNDVWRNSSTGQAFIVRFNLVFDATTDTPRVERFSERCLGS